MSPYGRAAGPNFPRRGEAGSVIVTGYAEQGSSDEMMISIAGGSKDTSELCDAESISWKAAGEEAGNDLESMAETARPIRPAPFRRRGPK